MAFLASQKTPSSKNKRRFCATTVTLGIYRHLNNATVHRKRVKTPISKRHRLCLICFATPDPKQDATIGEHFYVVRVSSAELEDVAVCAGTGLVTEEMLQHEWLLELKLETI